MAKLLFLLIVFIVAVGFSFYFSAEGFQAANTSALQGELVELNKTMNYLKSLGINAGSQNDTYNKTAKRIKEIDNILTPPDPKAELWAELGQLDKTMTYLKGLGINAGSRNDTYDKTVKRIGEINAILSPPPPVVATPVAAAPVVAPPVAAPPVVAPPVVAPTNVNTTREPPFPSVMLPDGTIMAGGQVQMCPNGYYFNILPGGQVVTGECAKIGTSGGPGNTVPGTCESNRILINGMCWGPCPPGTTQREIKCIPSQPAPNTTTDANGNVISNRLKDLISILTQSSAPVTPANIAAQQQARASVPASTSDNSGNHITTDNSGNEITLASFYETIKPQIKKDVSQAVRQEFERSTVLPKREQRNVASTPSIAQGVSWPSRPGCNGGYNGDQYEQPDMSEYIRKDSIPCWGCDVNY